MDFPDFVIQLLWIAFAAFLVYQVHKLENKLKQKDEKIEKLESLLGFAMMIAAIGSDIVRAIEQKSEEPDKKTQAQKPVSETPKSA